MFPRNPDKIRIPAAKIHAEPELQELHYHLAIEAEKFLRRHEAKCEECQKAVKA